MRGINRFRNNMFFVLIFSYAKFLSRQGKIQEAFQRMKIAQEIFVKTRGAFEPEHVDILNNLAVLALEVRSFIRDLSFIFLSSDV